MESPNSLSYLISIHAAQEGCDQKRQRRYAGNDYFNPRSPRGLRRWLTAENVFARIISIHAAQEGCDFDAAPFNIDYIISIHAAQEGCDGKCLKTCPLLKDFNPRSPRGLRLTAKRRHIKLRRFQSTQPKRAATIAIMAYMRHCHISIHAAQEGCDQQHYNELIASIRISIHAAQEGCDNDAKALITPENIFQSTQPKRAAT